MTAVRGWLWLTAALIFLMVIVGGATRLTESGLSITEWKPVAGVLPPLNAAAWLVEFEKYKQIPQYSQMFPDMTLGQFKTIFYWEWSHRLLGRLIGLVFALPLLWFAVRGTVRGKLLAQLIGVLVLGALQGIVGWWMVASGLVGRVEVAPERLAAHLFLASLTFVAVVWIVTGLLPVKSANDHPALERQGRILLGLVLLQIILGALVAGSRAGLSYNTWPLMDGHFVPALENLFRLQPWWLNFFENITTIQFQHRILAYLIVIFTAYHAWHAAHHAPHTAVQRRAFAIASIVLLQVGFGIATLLFASGRIPIRLALAHQAFAFVLLAMAAIHANRLSLPKRR